MVPPFSSLVLGPILHSLCVDAFSIPILPRQSTLQPASVLPTNWTYTGCYNDLQGSRTLAGPYTAGTGNSATWCISYCSNKGYVYAGTEYSDECYCDNLLAPPATLQPDSDCNMACSGNASEACGGGNRLTVYYANKPVPQGPTIAPAPPGWTSYGCWADGPTKSLANGVQVPGGTSNLTVELCTAACSGAGYTLAGVEYAGECYCDNYVATSAANTTLTQCNMPCNGNASEFCGAGNRMNIYGKGSAKPVVKPQSAIPPPPGGWSALGCYNDSQASRTLTKTQYLQVPMTIEACTASCFTAGFAYAGVEYGGECYCDSGLAKYATVQTDGRCSMACNGNSNETCGGPNGLNVFQLTGWYNAGCWTDNAGARTLNNGQYGLGDMTVEKCQASCLKNGFNYAGLEYANECFCDSSAQNGGGPAPDGNAGCTMACKGNTDEICGGPGRLNVWQYNSTGLPGAQPTTSTSVPAGGGGGTPVTTPTPTPTPSSSVNATAILPFVYQGCFTDNMAGGRGLGYQQPDNSSLTVESCIAKCTGQGYTIAGMEYSTQCFCDNYIRNAPTLVADTQCNMNCGGNSAEKCGAGGRLSIYSNGTMNNYTQPSIQKTGLPGSWQYQGCLTDVDGKRSLSYEIVFAGTNNNTNCMNLCAKYGYMAAGTEYGEQCYCGDIQDPVTAGATIRSDSECSTLCAGDKGKNGGYYCGGGSRLSYYTWQGDTLGSWTYATGNDAGLYSFLNSGPVIPLVTAPARNGKVTYLEKFGTSPANNATGAYEFDITLQDAGNYSATWRTMHVKSDVFCSASLTLPDRAGRQVNVGGWANDDTFGIRLYWPDGSPGVAGKNDWQENVKEVSLLEGRWYPSAMTLANGSILVMGGEQGSNGAAVPSLEVLPSPSGVALYCDYLARTDPNNLYPFLMVLPSGGIFVGYYNEARILNPDTLATQRTLPNMPGAVYTDAGGRTYPFEGTMMILPQYAPYTDDVSIIVCGGSTPYAEIGLDNCITMAPDQPNATWTIERMPSKRVMSNMVALPDGTYLILNGAQYGRAGFGLATQPNLNSVLYDPSKPIHQRMTVMANTTIARLYHSEAVLLDDGRVLVSGSDPEDVRAFAPQEYRNELWTPPYILHGGARPAFTVSDLDWAYGSTHTISITAFGTGAVGSYRVSLIGAVASTHGNSMGQRTIFPAVDCSAGSSCKVTAPPTANVCPPAWFQVFLLDANNVPSHASWVRIGGDPAGLGNWPAFPDFNVPGTGPVQPLF
nr:hypothetical protein B0A51_11072 [Rachicladosporium sp. CCFEE 5018]